jgi:DNA-binding NarL/FixJ family response regulator
MTENARIRILLVDDQSIFREGLRTLLGTQDDFDVIGDASHGLEAVERAAALAPDVILMDLRMPRLDGVAATRRLRELGNLARIIMLTTFDDDEHVFDGLRAGALGYLLKDVTSDKLFDAVRAAARGESFLQPSVAAKVVAEFARISATRTAQQPVETLSEREIEIVKLLAGGASNKEIGAALFLTEGTVKNYVSSILGKLGARDRTHAALRARELGML